MFLWTKLANGLVNGMIIGGAASVTERVSNEFQLPERLLTFGKVVLGFSQGHPGQPAVGAAGSPGSASSAFDVGQQQIPAQEYVDQAKDAAKAQAQQDAAKAELERIEAQRRAEAAAAEAAAAKARSDEAAKAAGDKHCACVKFGPYLVPHFSTSGAATAAAAGATAGSAAGAEAPNVGCASEHMCEKCSIGHVTEAAQRAPTLTAAEIDAVALAVPGDVFGAEPPQIPMPMQPPPGEPFDETAYQREFDKWQGVHLARERHHGVMQAAVGAVQDDLAECQKVVQDRGRQSWSCAQALEDARSALELELKAIAALGPNVGRAIDVERHRRGMRTWFMPVGQDPSLSTAADIALRQCQVTLADLNIKTQACEAELPKVKAALRVAQARRQELEALSQARVREKTDKAAADAQAAREAAERAALDALKAKAAAQQSAAQSAQPAAPVIVVTPTPTSYGPVTFPPQVPVQVPAPPAAPVPTLVATDLSWADDDLQFRPSRESASARGRDGDWDGELEEVGGRSFSGSLIASPLVPWVSPWDLPAAPSLESLTEEFEAAALAGCGCG